MEIRGVKFRVGRQWRVGGLYYPSGRSRTPAVLMLHGFPGVQQNEDMAAELCRRGFTVFLPRYGGCWGSDGVFQVKGLQEDARAALALLSRYRHVDSERVAILGYSVGGWIGLRVASERPLAAVVALAPAVPFEGAPKDDGYLRKNGRVVNLGSAGEVWKDYLRAARDDRPQEYLPKIAPAPLLLVQGRQDSLVPAWTTARLFAWAREPKQMLELPGEDHAFQTNRRRVVNEVCSWLESRMNERRAVGDEVEGAHGYAFTRLSPEEKAR